MKKVFVLFWKKSSLCHFWLINASDLHFIKFIALHKKREKGFFCLKIEKKTILMEFWEMWENGYG